MIPILYAAEETAFESNGIGRLVDALRCEVTEERNGIYELELDYPITGRWYSYIELGCYIGAIHDDHHDVQPFEVYKVSAPIDGIVTFYAHHISYQLSGIILQPFYATSITDLFNQIPAQSVNSNPFTFWTDKVVGSPFTLSVPSAVRQILAGQQGSVLDVYGTGEYKFDKYAVRLYLHRGSDTGVTIRYGKNLTDLKKELDGSQSYSAVAPYWTSADGTVYLPEIIVGAQHGSTFALDANGVLSGDFTLTAAGVIEGTIELTPAGVLQGSGGQAGLLGAVPLDLTDHFDAAPTEAELRAAALQYLEDNEPWIPDENISIDFLQLWQTSEYEDVAALQRVGLCDRVSVLYPALGVTAINQEVIKVVYDTLGEYYIKMELGKLQTNLYQSISQAAAKEIDAVSPGVLQAAIDKATQLITGGLGGYVVFTRNGDGQPQEILVMDTDDPMTAMSVIRINRNGIGFSTSGINGPYNTAWTIDGAFNADFITAGRLDAGLVKAGVLSSLDGTTFYLDLENGVLNMDASQLTLNGESMSVIIQGQTQPLADSLDDLRAHIVIGSDGSMTFIGADGNPITLRLVNDQLGIYNGNDLIDSFAASGTMTQNLTIPSGGSLSMGNFKWTPRSSGSLDLMWVGG